MATGLSRYDQKEECPPDFPAEHLAWILDCDDVCCSPLMQTHVAKIHFDESFVAGLLHIGLGIWNHFSAQAPINLPPLLPLTLPLPQAGLAPPDISRATLPEETSYRPSPQAEQRQYLAEILGNTATTLQAQQRQLEILALSQPHLSQKMAWLRQEIQTNFAATSIPISEPQAQRLQASLAKHTLILQREYQTFANFLIDATREELLIQSMELKKSAVELEVWLDVALSKLAPGTPERLPFRVTQAYAVRAKADANWVRGGAYQKEAERDLQQFAAHLRQELIDLCHQKTLYYLGVDIPEIIAQYGFLYRGLQRGRLKQRQADPNPLLEASDFVWDDKLGALRALFNSTTGKTSADQLAGNIPLKTVDDLEWFIRYVGLDRMTFDVQKFLAQNPEGIAIRKLLVPLGILFVAPTVVLDCSLLRKLDPERLRRGFMHQMRQHFNIDQMQILMPGQYPFHYLTT